VRNIKPAIAMHMSSYPYSLSLKRHMIY
jgi:hypothetical protein